MLVNLIHVTVSVDRYKCDFSQTFFGALAFVPYHLYQA